MRGPVIQAKNERSEFLACVDNLFIIVPSDRAVCSESAATWPSISSHAPSSQPKVVVLIHDWL